MVRGSTPGELVRTVGVLPARRRGPTVEDLAPRTAGAAGGPKDARHHGQPTRLRHAGTGPRPRGRAGADAPPAAGLAEPLTAAARGLVAHRDAAFVKRALRVLGV